MKVFPEPTKEQLDQFYLMTEKQPTAKHANSNDCVLYYTKNMGFMEGRWDYPISDATHWLMLPDPPTPGLTVDEKLEKDFQRMLNKEFPNPVIERALMEPVLRKFFFRGKTL